MRWGESLIYNEAGLAQMIRNQKKHQRDFFKEAPWNDPIRNDRFLVPLDENAILFPGSDSHQRRVISHLMGLVIAVCIYEMEDCLIRMRDASWEQFKHKYPVSPEFSELGDLFFEEEAHHADAFRSYVKKYAKKSQIPLDTLLWILPSMRNSISERLLSTNLRADGEAFWWIVAIVEQQFLHLYHVMKPHQDQLDPLFFRLNQLHYEEESRHAPFPYLLIDLIEKRSRVQTRRLHRTLDLAFAQSLQSLWALDVLRKIKSRVRTVRNEHSFFLTLDDSLSQLDQQPSARTLFRIFTQAPYLSSLLNPRAHMKVTRFSKYIGSYLIPFPEIDPNPMVDY